MTYGLPPRYARADPPPFSGIYLAEDLTFGWQVMTYDANAETWSFTGPSGWSLASLPLRWTQLPPRFNTED